jgi:hypothetical protein
MSKPHEIQFACIGCGAMNPAGAEVCSGCGHRFREPTSFPSPRVPGKDPYEAPGSPAGSTNPYEAPRSRVAGAPTFRIGTAMVLIAVVALCLGAFASGVMEGTLVTLGLLPATIRTFYIAGRREAEGRPMSLGGKISTFSATVGGLILIVFSSIVAFGLTCFPIGMTSGDLGLALGAGIIAGLAAAGGLTYTLIKASRAAARRELDRETIRWR